MLGKQEDEVSSSAAAQNLTVLEKKLEETATHLPTKKLVKKVGAREVVQCSNDNHFWGLDVDIALVRSPFRCCIASNAPNIATNKSNKIPCNQLPEIATE